MQQQAWVRPDACVPDSCQNKAYCAPACVLHTMCDSLARDLQAAVKSGHDWKRVGREIRILKRLTNHPAVIHLLDVVSLPTEVYVIQELAAGGSLLDHVRERKSLPEATARRFFVQVVAGLQFCHAKDVRVCTCTCICMRML